ncbi:MAG: hypothetical protein JNM80_01865 [Phycisphaerae bacterium]|nr:hypothetical protein [Phycisphaerae bacterium]
MQWTRRLVAPALAGMFLSANAFVAAAQPPAQPETITEDGVIAGVMDIDFGTRTNLDTSGDLKAGSPAIGAKDTYKFSLSVAKTTEFAGTVTRQPNLYTKNLGRRKQDALLTYSIDLALFNPRDLKQKRNVGKWVGTVPIDTASGAYDLAGGKAKESPLRISVDAVGKAAAFVDNFGGRLIGKAEKKDSLAQYTFKRVVGNKTTQIVVKKSDPMRFENLILAKGPSENYPRTTVTGRLDYDYETGNWFTDGIRFTYNLDGKDVEDIITGSIKWVEDPDRVANGKGFYEFNLRFNEAKNKSGSSEAAAFEKMSDEEAFFAVDNSVPCLTGRVTYVDSMGSGDLPTSSKVTFALNANKLTKQQVMNFFKLWMLAVGPTNDE